jgi:hypothetical protein
MGVYGTKEMKPFSKEIIQIFRDAYLDLNHTSL